MTFRTSLPILLLIFLLSSCSFWQTDHDGKAREEGALIIKGEEIDDSIAMNIVFNDSKAETYNLSSAEGGGSRMIWKWTPSSWKAIFDRYGEYVSPDTVFKVGHSGEDSNIPVFIYSPMKSFKTDSLFIVFYNFKIDEQGFQLDDVTKENRGFIGGAVFKKDNDGWVLIRKSFKVSKTSERRIGFVADSYIGDAGMVDNQPHLVVYTTTNVLTHPNDLNAILLDYSLQKSHVNPILTGYEHEINALAHDQLPMLMMKLSAEELYEEMRGYTDSSLPDFDKVLPKFVVRGNKFHKINYYNPEADRNSLKRGEVLVYLQGRINVNSQGVSAVGKWIDGITGTNYTIHPSGKEITVVTQEELENERLRLKYDYPDDNYGATYAEGAICQKCKVGYFEHYNFNWLCSVCKSDNKVTNGTATAQNLIKDSPYYSDGKKCDGCKIGTYRNGTCDNCGSVSDEKHRRFKENLRENNSHKLCSFCDGTGRSKRSGGECAQCVGTGVSPR